MLKSSSHAQELRRSCTPPSPSAGPTPSPSPPPSQQPPSSNHRKPPPPHTPFAMDALKTSYLPNLSMEASVLTTAHHFCPMCGQQFETPQHAADHLQQCHGVITGVNGGSILLGPVPQHLLVADSLKLDYPCLNCDEKFLTSQDLDDHNRLVHQASAFLARCLACGIYGISSITLNEGDEYKCQHCGSVCTAAALMAGQPAYLDPQVCGTEPQSPEEMSVMPPEEMNSMSAEDMNAMAAHELHEQQNLQHEQQQQLSLHGQQQQLQTLHDQQQMQLHQQQQQHQIHLLHHQQQRDLRREPPCPQMSQYHESQSLEHDQQLDEDQDQQLEQRHCLQQSLTPQPHHQQHQQLHEIFDDDARKVPPLTVKLNGSDAHPQVIIKKEIHHSPDSNDRLSPTLIPTYTIQARGGATSVVVSTADAVAATSSGGQESNSSSNSNGGGSNGSPAISVQANTTPGVVGLVSVVNTATLIGNKTRHKCPECPRTFKTPGTLAMHRKIHSGEADNTPKERPFTCSFCSKSFTQSNTLKQHTRIHTGEKPFRCGYCGRAFTVKDYLNKHLTTHTGEKPYHCSYCEKAFSVKDYLTKHIRTHTGEKPYICPYCDKRFTQRSALTVHTTKLHPS